MRPAMTSVFEAYLVPIIIALVIGVVIAWWAFGRKSDTRTIGDSHRPSETSEAPPVAQPKTPIPKPTTRRADGPEGNSLRSEEHTSELQSLMRISYAVFCLQKKTHQMHATTISSIPQPPIT